MDYKPFTLSHLEELVKTLEKNRAPKDVPLQLPCSDYPSLSDEEFKVFVRQKNVTFLGGLEGYRKMKERMKKLNIV